MGPIRETARLRDVIAKCKSNNMPNGTITRSIKKAAGEDSGVVYEAITYEGCRARGRRGYCGMFDG